MGWGTISREMSSVAENPHSCAKNYLLDGVKKYWGQSAAANIFKDQQALETSRLWQSPIFSHLAVPVR